MPNKRKPTGLQWIGRMSDFPKYQDAIDAGYAGSYDQWIKEGKPKGGAPLSARTRAIMGTPEFATAEASRQAGIFGQPPIIGARPPPKPEPAIQMRKPSGLEEAQKRLADFEQMYGRGSYYIDYNNETQEYEVKRDPDFFKEKREESRGNKLPFGFNRYDNPLTPEVEGGWTGTEWAPPYGWISPEEERATGLKKEEMAATQQFQQAQLDWQREQAAMQQAESERQYRSQLMANPMSWLQYSSYTGQTPVVQPWMKPLMSGQYNIGQAMPGWQSQGQGQQELGQPMSTLPELRNPSMQYWARMGPTAQQQLMGYQQVRTGIRPEESMFRQRATAAPSGRFSGLRWMR